MGSGEAMPGDWLCETCNVNNFARRTHCIDCKKSKDALLDSKYGGKIMLINYKNGGGCIKVYPRGQITKIRLHFNTLKY